jgi:hypothetical protein
MTRIAALAAIALAAAPFVPSAAAQEASAVMPLETAAAETAEAAGTIEPTAPMTPLEAGESLEAAWRVEPGRIFVASDVDLEALQWVARPVVVFANSARDPAFLQQMQEIAAEFPRLLERDVIVIADTDPENPSALRDRLRPRGFMLALIGKDGEIELRKPQPWTVRELSRSIDKMPLRRQEIRDRRTSG